MAPGSRIPDRWEKYTKIGKPISGTRFICFKVPLKEAASLNLSDKEKFTPSQLIETVKDLGHVIDLTFTTRYYDPSEFTKKEIGHTKIFCPGQVIPPPNIVQQFFAAADVFFKDDKRNGKLLGVHCTHGLNRTGYLVCKYMIDRLGYEVENAILEFNKARGHIMERDEYVNALRPHLVLPNPTLNISPYLPPPPASFLPLPPQSWGRGRAIDRRRDLQLTPIAAIERQPNVPCAIIEKFSRNIGRGRGRIAANFSVNPTVSSFDHHEPLSSPDNEIVFLGHVPAHPRDDPWSNRSDDYNHRRRFPRAYDNGFQGSREYSDNRNSRSRWNSYENDTGERSASGPYDRRPRRDGSRDDSSSLRRRYDEYSSRDRDFDNRSSSRDRYHYRRDKN